MSIIEEVTAKAQSAVEQKSPTSDVLKTLLEFMNRPEIGGLPGLVQKFDDAGLGSQVKSWIGGGTTQSITPDDVTRVLGRSGIAEMAAKVGLPTNELTRHVSQVLPEAVRHLLPGSDGPSGGVIGEIGSFIKDKFVE